MSSSKRIQSGLNFLKKNCDPQNAFQNDRMGKRRDLLAPAFHPPENFTSIIALDFLGKLLDEETRSKILLHLKPQPGHGLYGSKNMYKLEKLIPDDIELTGLIMWTFLRDGVIENNQQLLDVARLLIMNTDKNNGVMQTYFPPRSFRSGRIDEAIACSALRLLYTLGLDGEAMDTENHLWSYLEKREYLQGTRYYFSPDVFLLYLARAVDCSSRAKVKFQDLIYDEVKSRLCSNEFPIDISLRILTLNVLGFLNREDIKDDVNKELKILEGMQNADGGFQEDCLYKKGRSDTYFGGNTISTIMAVAALNCFCK